MFFKYAILKKYRIVGAPSHYNVPSIPNELKFAKTPREKEYLSIIKTLLETARQDPMTGLSHKEHFTTVNKGNGVFIAIDGDGLKKLNDTFGHDAGHAAILSISDGIKAVVRTTRGDEVTHITRSGGDEFIVFLPNAALSTGVTVAKRILDSVRTQKISTHYVGDNETKAKLSAVKLSVSIGVGYTFKDADKAQYRAKENGRNRVEFYRYPKEGMQKAA